MDIEELRTRLKTIGMDEDTVFRHGVDPLVSHAGRVGQKVGPWLDVLFDFVSILHARQITLWSPIAFTVDPLAKASGSDVGLFSALMDETRNLLMDLRDKKIKTARTEQYGVRVIANAFKGDGTAIARSLRFARQLAAQGGDPGWFLQLTLPALKERAAFEERLNALAGFLSNLSDPRALISYPLAAGLVSVAKIISSKDDWDTALTLLAALIKSLDPSMVVGVLRGGLEGLETLPIPSENLIRGLRVSVSVADRGHDPTLVLRRGCVSADLLLIAEKMTAEGCNPAPVLAGALDVYQTLGLLENDAERLVNFGLGLKTQRGRGRRFFEEALPWVWTWEKESPGYGLRVLSLAEGMIERGLDPAMTILFGIPWAVGAKPAPAGLRECVFEFAHTLTANQLDPTDSLRFGIPPLVALSKGDAARFRELLAAVTQIIVSLKKKGADVQDILFHDIQRMVEKRVSSDVFIAFLRRLQRVFDLWTAQGAPLDVLAERGLPILAQESANKPWLMDVAFDRVERLGQEKKISEAVGMLEHCLAVASRAAGPDPEVFRQALDALERSLHRLPPELASVAPAVAGALAGRDVAILEMALNMIADRAPSPCPEFLADGLPSLSRLAVDAKSLGSMMDMALAMYPSVPEDRRAAWWGGGLEAAGRVTAGHPQAAQDFLEELARRSGEWIRADWLLKKATPLFARKLSSPSEVLKAVEGMAGEVKVLGDDEPTLAVVLSLAAEAPTLSEVQDRLDVLRRAILPAKERQALINGLTDVLPPVKRHAILWESVVKPLLVRQGARAGEVLQCVATSADRFLTTKENGDALMEIIAQRGVRAVDAIKMLLWPALYEKVIPSLGEDRKVLLDYLNDIGFHNLSIYSRYRSIITDKDLPRSEKARRVEALGREINALAEGIRRGKLTPEEENSDLLGVALQYIFPPATSAIVQDYLALYRRFEDRPEDLDRLKTSEAKTFQFSISGGEWRMAPHAKVDLEVWQQFIPPPDSSLPAKTLEAEGWELLSDWSEGLLGRSEYQRENMPRLSLRAGGRAPSGDLHSPDALIALRDFAANRMRDYVEEVLLAAKTSDPQRYERLVRGKLAPTLKVGKGLVKGVEATLEAHRERRLSRQEAVERLARQLEDFEWTNPDPLLAAKTREEIQGVLSRLPTKTVPLNAGVEVDRVHQELVGQTLRSMRQILHGEEGKPGCLEFVQSSGARTLTLELTKRRAHAAVGFAEGVCVARDKYLWNKPNFWQAILWNENGVSEGGVHLLVVDDADGTYVTLPGINPSLNVLADSSAELLLDRVVEFAWRVAEALGARGVWVPVNPTIHSNRRGIHDAIAAKKWPIRTCQEHTFSESPYRYSFTSVFDVPRSATQGLPQ